MKYKILILMMLSWLAGHTQKEDYVWLAGYDSKISFGHLDTINHVGWGISKLDFNFSPRSVIYDSLGMDFSRTCVTYSDTNGQLLFYSNGIQIHNKWDELVEGGDSLNAGWLIYVYDSTEAYGPEGGYREPQNMICIPIPDSSGHFFLINSFLDSSFEFSRVLICHLDMTANNGHGKVIFKNRTLIQSNVIEQLTSVRHGNGKDWWILSQEANTNCYFKILVDKNGATLMPNKTCIGLATNPNDGGGCCFSPDGIKYAVINYYTGLSIYDFDRCTGELSNPMNLPLPQLADSGWFLNGVSFSPNSRFLYVTATIYCYQFDTWATDIWGSIDTVADVDTFGHGFDGYATPQLAPDGRIYIANGNTCTNYHVIDSPDMKGRACAFRKHGLFTPSFQHDVPNFQNYRLGRLLGSSCDTLTDLLEINARQLEIRVEPIPAHDYFIVDYGLADWTRHKTLVLKVTDIRGQTVYSYSLPRYSALHKVNTSSFADGMYLVEILDGDGSVLSVKKVVKEE